MKFIQLTADRRLSVFKGVKEFWNLESELKAIEDWKLEEENRKKGGDRPCFNCGEVGHRKPECPNPPVPREGGGGGGGDRPCFNCGEVGHRKSDCPNPAVPREGGGGGGDWPCF